MAAPLSAAATARLSLLRAEGPEAPYMTMQLRLPDGARLAGAFSLAEFALAVTGRTETPLTLTHDDRSQGALRGGASLSGGERRMRLADDAWTARFGAALACLCRGVAPPEALVAAWFSSDDERLQAWAVTHTALPWAQGIALIDAAASLADTPEEGT